MTVEGDGVVAEVELASDEKKLAEIVASDAGKFIFSPEIHHDFFSLLDLDSNRLTPFESSVSSS